MRDELIRSHGVAHRYWIFLCLGLSKRIRNNFETVVATLSTVYSTSLATVKKSPELHIHGAAIRTSPHNVPFRLQVRVGRMGDLYTIHCVKETPILRSVEILSLTAHTQWEIEPCLDKHDSQAGNFLVLAKSTAGRGFECTALCHCHPSRRETGSLVGARSANVDRALSSWSCYDLHRKRTVAATRPPQHSTEKWKPG
nr:hypothetical protein CFP56_50402 [Quercus suber]